MLPADFYLIRGLAREAGHWGEFKSLLAEQVYCHDIHCLDLPGAGKFHKLTSPISIEENAEFLKTQLDETKGSRSQVIVAVSMGAMVAVELVKKMSHRFDYVFLMNTSFANLSPIYYRLQTQTFKKFYKILRSPDTLTRELEVLKMVSRKPEKWDLIAKEWALIAEQRPMKIKNFAIQLLAAATYRIDKNKPTIPMVVLNSAGDQMVDPRCSEDLAKHWNLPIETHPEAGHDICIDDPQWVLKMIAKHLESDLDLAGP